MCVYIPSLDSVCPPVSPLSLFRPPVPSGQKRSRPPEVVATCCRDYAREEPSDHSRVEEKGKPKEFPNSGFITCQPHRTLRTPTLGNFAYR